MKLKCFRIVTSGGGSGVKFCKIILFQHATTSEMKLFQPLQQFYWATVCKTVGPMLSDRCLSCLSVCPVCLSVCLSVTLVYCGQTV